jgi:hypothetical protein
MVMAKRYRVTYYQWFFDKYGDKDYSYMSHWASESTLADLKEDSSVDELEIHEEEEYTE